MKKNYYQTNMIFSHVKRLVTYILCVYMLFSTQVQGQSTLRLYLIGNSVTDAINYNGLKALAESRGNTHVWARQMIPGAPLEWLWSHPADGFSESPYGYPSNAFPNYTWDAISLQPFDRFIDGAGQDKEMFGNYINLSKGKSPNAQYYVYMRWPRMPNGNSVAECTTCSADEWTRLWSRSFTGGYDGTQETKDFFEKLLLSVRSANFTSKQPLIVPVGEVFNKLNTKMKNGQVAGYNSIWQVYSDGIHMSGTGSYIAACTYYATLYKADPRGLGVPSEFGSISSSLASIIQTTVWEVVSTYAYSGVGSSVAVTSIGVSPTTLSLSVGQSSQISATVNPSNASNKGVTWTSSNTNIASVNSSGQVTAIASGSANITATSVDGGKTATTSVTVSAASTGVAGLNYQFYTGSWDVLPNFSSLTPTKTGTVSNIDLSPRTQDDLFAFRYTGSIQIANAGTYTFYTSSDDGSKLYIDGTQIVDNDGLHGMTEKSGQVVLTAGKHTFEATIFEKTGGEGLEVRYEGPSISKQLIPASLFSTNSSVSVSSIAVNPGTASIMIGKTSQLSATISPSNATNQGVTWTSSNTAIATVNTTGLVSGVAAGTATITVKTNDGSKTATSAITVFANSQPIAVLNASVTSGNAPLKVDFSANGSSDPNSGDFILGYDWEFGDGTAKEYSNAPSHTFVNAGTYTVSLKVMDNNNLYSNAVTKTITVSSAGGGSAGPTGYTLCSSEGQTCTLNGTQDIAYGANGTFAYLYNQTGSISCSNATFGDPLSGVFKSCYVRNSPSQTGSVVRETWTGISGNAVNLIPTSTAPTTTANITSLEIPVDNSDNYGTRIRGYIIPSSTGNYTFYVSGDDDVELWLSTNSDPATRVRIANISGWTNSREWTKYASQTSSAKSLTANTKYYFEVLHKEGAGGDNLAVGWTGPNISTISVIGGSNIAPFTGSSTPIPTDTQAPTAPSGLSSANVTQNSFTLNWNASTDNVGVTSYEIFRGGSSIGTATATSFAVTGLTAGTAYNMTVKAKDAAGNVSGASASLSVTTSNNTTPPPTGTPKLPIGMNINSTNYYTAGLIYTDVMCASSEMFTFYDGGPWNSEQINNIPRDVNGYPTQLPYNVGGQNQKVRFLINNNYSGRYVMLYDGVGKFTVNGLPNSTINGKFYIDFNGTGGNIWIDITESQAGNNLRNIRIVPEQYANGSTYPTFLAKFLDGLRPFHALRFMDWTSTNGSSQKNWSDRCTKTYYSQCTGKGSSIEYAIELANTLDAHAWFCVPHMASDDYHRQMARLIRDNMKSSLKLYLEYSNEVWNWQFSQASWVLSNAQGSVDSYVSSDLARIDPNTSSHPEKDAYMMARAFRLFKGEFTGTNASRLVKVAAVQHGWPDNTRRVLEYLKVNNQQCDWVAPGGYFNFEQADHDLWNTQCGAVTADQVVAGAAARYDAGSGSWTDQTATFANQYGVGYAVYEGGQHMQPWQQSDWCYNNAVYDAQISPKMYDLYMKNFRKHVESKVNCKLFMAFSYIGERKSKYGSWGHLESLAQVGGVNGNYMTTAPKYQALLDANMAKGVLREGKFDSDTYVSKADGITVYPNPIEDVVNVSVNAETETTVQIIISDLIGNTLVSTSTSINPGNTIVQINTANLTMGVYLVTIIQDGNRTVRKIAKS